MPARPPVQGSTASGLASSVRTHARVGGPLARAGAKRRRDVEARSAPTWRDVSPQFSPVPRLRTIVLIASILVPTDVISDSKSLRVSVGSRGRRASSSSLPGMAAGPLRPATGRGGRSGCRRCRRARRPAPRARLDVARCARSHQPRGGSRGPRRDPRRRRRPRAHRPGRREPGRPRNRRRRTRRSTPHPYGTSPSGAHAAGRVAARVSSRPCDVTRREHGLRHG